MILAVFLLSKTPFLCFLVKRHFCFVSLVCVNFSVISNHLQEIRTLGGNAFTVSA